MAYGFRSAEFSYCGSLSRTRYCCGRLRLLPPLLRIPKTADAGTLPRSSQATQNSGTANSHETLDVAPELFHSHHAPPHGIGASRKRFGPSRGSVGPLEPVRCGGRAIWTSRKRDLHRGVCTDDDGRPGASNSNPSRSSDRQSKIDHIRDGRCRGLWRAHVSPLGARAFGGRQSETSLASKWIGGIDLPTHS